MKKILSLVLTLLMVTSVLLLVGCNEEPAEKLKLGLGVHSYYESATDASEDANGKANVISTFAAVLVDKDGKIVKCEIDSVDAAVQYTAAGKFIFNDNVKTKYELGDDYNMVTYGGAKKEWYQQVDAFEKLVEGKTSAEVKALLAAGDKGNADVIAAGCTVKINEFVIAVEEAIANAKASEATADNTFKITAVTEMSGIDAVAATEDAAATAGSVEMETTIVAAAVDADKKVVAMINDCITPKFTFDEKGAATTDTTTAIKTKLELGDDYNMKLYGGSTREWYEHAAAFDATCIGKTSAEIAGLAADGVAGDALVKAGCTIGVGGMVKAAVKATK